MMASSSVLFIVMQRGNLESPIKNIFKLWEETRVPAEKIHMREENMQSPQRQDLARVQTR